MEKILVIGDRTKRSNDGRSSGLTEEIELRVRRERHRRWRPEEKLRIVQETLRPGEVIAAVARRHGIGTGLLYTWRKEMLSTAMGGFAPVQVERDAPREVAAPISSVTSRPKAASGRIEIEFANGVRVRIDGSVDDAVLRGVLSTLSGS
jgi:transposase